MVAADFAALDLAHEDVLEARRVDGAARPSVRRDPDVLDVGPELDRGTEVAWCIKHYIYICINEEQEEKIGYNTAVSHCPA